jgi:hypothetical protein
MDRTKQTSKWIIDLVLLVVFLVEFYMDLTGVALHQWMGMTLAVAILYHLVTHWAWVKLVTARFFNQTSSRARLYYLLDGGLLAGFGTIIATGLVISTWLSLPLNNYATWYDVHVFSSIATLALLVGKLAAHWRWIVQNSMAIFGRGKPAARPAVPAAPAVQPINAISRRHFLTMMGGLTLASMVSIGTALNGATGASAVQATTGTATSSPATGSGSTGSTTTQNQLPAATATTVQSQSTSTATSAPTATQAATSTTASSAIPCTLRCNKGCAFPGRCRKYSDSNGNGRCDLGECA